MSGRSSHWVVTMVGFYNVSVVSPGKGSRVAHQADGPRLLWDRLQLSRTTPIVNRHL